MRGESATSYPCPWERPGGVNEKGSVKLHRASRGIALYPQFTATRSVSSVHSKSSELSKKSSPAQSKGFKLSKSCTPVHKKEWDSLCTFAPCSSSQQELLHKRHPSSQEEL